MCTVALALAGVSGVGSAIADRQAKMAQYRAQKAAVDRSNYQARQDYLNKIQISAFKDQQKQNVFKAQLEAQSASVTAMEKQRDINQLEQSRASTANQLKLKEKVAEALFEGQEKLAESIRAQGTILASGMSAGQSTMLTVSDEERKLGQSQAAIDASLFNARQSYGLQEYNTLLSQYSADSRAFNNVIAAPVAPSAEFKTVRPIKMAAPEKPSMLGSIMTGFSAAVKTGSGIGNADPTKQWWSTN
tara:strand:+ start:1457 stop:2194 length:738 start_codon:yes stop_codon:yes gene_type:complete